MKHLKILGLALVAAAALTALFGAGSAAATKLCTSAACTTDYAAGTEIESSLSSSTIFETTGGTVLETCTGGEMNGKTSATSGEPLRELITTFTWTGCTKTKDTIASGELKIRASGSADGNGTLTGAGSSWTTNGIFGTSCVYGTGTATTLGTLNGGNPATISINTLVPRTVENALCPKEIRWTATYQFTSPTPLFVG
ncbi:MAG TPA: hypothetical protein VFJ76_08140 [Solirubrobacterales bacterium]|nr:hypothetical protein [Solirubrobacterales bacterium]